MSGLTRRTFTAELAVGAAASSPSLARTDSVVLLSSGDEALLAYRFHAEPWRW